MDNEKKQIVLNCEKLETRFSMLNNGKLEEYLIERGQCEPRVGSVFIGKIVNLEPTLQAAFVDIGTGKNAFLHYWDMMPAADESEEDINDEHEKPAMPAVAVEPRNKKRTSFSEKLRRVLGQTAGSKQLREKEKSRRRKKITLKDIPDMFPAGTELLVQVVKGPIGTKGPRVTTNLSIPGRYLVLLPYSDHIGLSSKIDNAQERQRLKKILSELDVPEGMGLICRTVGEGRKSIFFKRDLDMLLDYWHKVELVMSKGVVPSIVYSEPSLLERTIRDFITDDIDEIVVDNDTAFHAIHNELVKFGGARMARKVIMYDRDIPIFERLKIEDQINDIFKREVQLPGGGYICIDETEALIAIDVNTGKSRKLGDQPETILQTNLEAAEEVARQLRLRNIGGLVVIDFIDMRSAHDRETIFKNMKKLVKSDRAKTKLLPLSKLGLMEMTRQRENESLKDTLYDPCPYCNGSGNIKSVMTMSVEIQRRLNEVLRRRNSRTGLSVRVIMHPDVLARLKNEDAGLLQELEEKFGKNLSFRADAILHHEEFKLVDPDTNVEY